MSLSIRALACLALVLGLAHVPDVHAQGAKSAARSPHAPAVRLSKSDAIAQSRVERERTATYAELAARRALNVQRFAEYVGRRSYPQNTFEPGMLNVFIDANGRICAAATLMTNDGHEALVRATAAENNFIRLGELTNGPLFDWILESGFTQEEVARIQQPFWREEQDARLRQEFGELLAVEPATPIVDVAAVETSRLAQLYAEILLELETNQGTSLSLATDRLIARRHG